MLFLPVLVPTTLQNSGEQVHAAPKSGGEPVVIHATTVGGAFLVAADESGVYWVSQDEGAVQRAAK